MAQFIGDYLKENFRSFHHDEPLDGETVKWIKDHLKVKFPEATDEQKQYHIELVFDVQELKEFRFSNTMVIEASSMDEAKEMFANSSFGFAADADCEEIQ
jgi:hypothetical protein